MATHPKSIIGYYKYDMLLSIHLDASYPTKGKNQIVCIIIKHVAASVSESELGGLLNMERIGKTIRLTLIELGHPQIPTQMHTENPTST